ncbi:hypothetical protein SAMN05216548_1222 [Faunimonas pinastri]|uniref:Uncharacterized protein n=1 Tax=Faunimonas pinastri TaxID=1855383 RepID=A0A1H9PPU0_9HYPH|nr:hypothetical protein [Faunimonas pinastri]SER50232.1 hypothetical protein SAMN05216548_1222 [Faunimonas pinastri]
MDELRKLAYLSVMRSIMVPLTAIAILMALLSFHPDLALKVGGLGCIGLSALLFYRSSSSGDADPTNTELWGLVSADPRARRGDIRKQVNETMAEAYLRFARFSAAASVAFFAGAIAARSAL